MRRTRIEKHDEVKQGPSLAPATPHSPENKTGGAPTRHADEEPTNRILLDAIQELKNEAIKNKEDICRILDTRIEQVYNDLRGEINAVKTQLLAPIAKLEANSQALNNTVREIEQATSIHSDGINSLENQVAELKAEVVKLDQKCEDLEGRSRRQNIRILNIPEGREGPKPTEFIATFLKDILDLRELPLVDRAHRLAQQRSRPSESRPFILRLHYYHTREEILRKAATAKDLQYQGKQIRIFPDYAPSVAKRRAQFNKTRDLLRNQPGVKYGLLYPARLLVTHDGTQVSFTDPLQAEEYAQRLSRKTAPAKQ